MSGDPGGNERWNAGASAPATGATLLRMGGARADVERDAGRSTSNTETYPRSERRAEFATARNREIFALGTMFRVS